MEGLDFLQRAGQCGTTWKYLTGKVLSESNVLCHKELSSGVDVFDFRSSASFFIVKRNYGENKDFFSRD